MQVLLFLDENRKNSGLDSKSLVFWKNGQPSLQFMETDQITFIGENIMSMRPEVDPDKIKVYILTFYRILDPDTLVHNLRTMSEADGYWKIICCKS